MSWLLPFVQKGVVAGLGIGVVKILSYLPVLEKDNHTKLLEEEFPGVYADRDLAFAMNTLLDFRGYAPDDFAAVIVGCEKVCVLVKYFRVGLRTMTPSQACEFPKKLSHACFDVRNKLDHLCLVLVSSRSDLETDISAAADTIKKAIDNYEYNIAQDVEVYMETMPSV